MECISPKKHGLIIIFRFLGISFFELKNHILPVKSIVPNVKSNFLTIGPGLGTQKKLKNNHFQ
jgi:hypothetical protein